MFKIKTTINLNDKEITDLMKAEAKSAFARSVARMSTKVQSEAKDRLRGSLPIWEQGYKVVHKSETEYIISIDEGLAAMIETGFAAGELGKLIMNGNRARINQAEGKDYVDVPIMEQPKSASRVQSANDLMKNFTVKKFKFSDVKNQSVKMEARATAAINKHMKETMDTNASKVTKKHVGDNPSFLSFVRVTKQSTFPASAWEGLQSFDLIDQFFDQFFEAELARSFK